MAMPMLRFIFLASATAASVAFTACAMLMGIPKGGAGGGPPLGGGICWAQAGHAMTTAAIAASDLRNNGLMSLPLLPSPVMQQNELHDSRSRVLFPSRSESQPVKDAHVRAARPA